MASPTSNPELSGELLTQLLDGPTLRPDAIAAGIRRAADGPVDADRLADAVVAEGPPLLQRA